MDIMHERVAGLDVHKAIIVACVRLIVGGSITRECRTFDTTTAGLLALLAWLTESGCTHVAMEATGVYWKPVWNILSDGKFELIVANAAHIKNVPGRKTDVNDATWIADLVACGLIKASFVPEEEIQELRSLLRTRKQLTREQTSHVQRIQKTLEEANIKLDSVISDIMGLSGRKMIEAMIAGLRNPAKLAELADRRIKASPKVLYDALHGRMTDHHCFLLRLHLGQYDALSTSIEMIDRQVDAAITKMDEEVAAGQATFRALILLLCTIPGIGPLAATVILSEIGRDMSRFPTAGHLLAWAGMCPGQNESAGKRKSSRLRKGAPWLKTLLVQCAWAATRKKDSYYKAQFNRLRGRRGPKKAICAVAASMLTAIYHMLKDGTEHQDLGADHFDRRSTDVKANRLVAQLTKLGFQVQLQPLSQAA
ncbi:IS110 family transposase [Telmatospirillum sp.]|uniref:IS110 family transposase n=1 Tax=Telmatospirillum sp. TaxID=2079197 RepID=UPI00283DC0F0|nr:IS110 family transposase [Telmatospirillum sp.]MDR3438715.1 IS110 family transposase [Telmatospirillum sp.]